MDESSNDIFTIIAGIMVVAKKFWYILVVLVVLGGVGGALASKYVIQPKYSAKSTLFTIFKQDSDINISQIQNELNANYKLINDYTELLKSKKVQEEIINNIIANKFRNSNQIALEFQKQRERGIESPSLEFIPDYSFEHHGVTISPRDMARRYIAQSSINSESVREKRFLYITTRHTDGDIALLVNEATVPAFIKVSGEIIGQEVDIKIIDPPILLLGVSPSQKKLIAIGLFLGFAASLGIFFLIHFFDDRLYSLKEIEQMTERKIASTISYIPNLDNNLYEVYNAERSPLREAIYLLRENLTNSIAKDSELGKTIMFSSMAQGNGKSLITTSLWLSFANLNKKVVLLDLDFRRARVHKMLNVKNQNGIVDYITSEIKLDDIIKTDELINQDYIVTGSRPLYSVNLLNSEKLKNAIDELRKKYDYILIDAPPCIGIADPFVISRFSDIFIFVVDIATTKRKHFEHALDLLRHNDIDIHSIVVNCTNEVGNTENNYYYSSYKYNY